MRIFEWDRQSSSPSFRIFWNEIRHDFSAWRALLRQRRDFPRAGAACRMDGAGAACKNRTTRRSSLHEGRCFALLAAPFRTICDALPRHRPAAWLSAPWICARAGSACVSRTIRRSSLQFWIDSVGRVEKSWWHGGGWASTTGSSGFA